MSCDGHRRHYWQQVAQPGSRVTLMLGQGDPDRAAVVLEMIYRTAGSRATRNPADVEMGDQETLFADMIAGGGARPEHGNGTMRNSTLRAYAEVQRTLSSIRRGATPLPSLSAQIVGSLRLRGSVLARVHTDWGHQRCADCGRWTGPTRPHLCPVGLTPDSMAAAVAARLGVPPSVYGPCGVAWTAALTRLSGRVGSRRMELEHAVTLVRMDAPLDHVPEMVGLGYVPREWVGMRWDAESGIAHPQTEGLLRPLWLRGPDGTPVPTPVEGTGLPEMIAGTVDTILADMCANYGMGLDPSNNRTPDSADGVGGEAAQASSPPPIVVTPPNRGSTLMAGWAGLPNDDSALPVLDQSTGDLTNIGSSTHTVGSAGSETPRHHRDRPVSTTPLTPTAWRALLPLRNNSGLQLGTDMEAFKAAYHSAIARHNEGQPVLSYNMENATGGMATRESGHGFGVEIEFESNSSARSAIAHDLYAAGICPTANIGYRDNTPDSTIWYLGSDCTVSGGELISPVLYDEPAAWETLQRVCCIIQGHGGTISTNCGGHVHIGLAGYGNDTDAYQRLVRLIVHQQDLLFRLSAAVGQPRHRGTTYCSPLSLTPRGYHHLAPLGGMFRELSGSAVSFESMGEGRPEDHVEFRSWDGSLNPAEIQAHVRLSVAYTIGALRLSAAEISTLPDEPYGSHQLKRSQDPVLRQRLNGEVWEQDSASFRRAMDLLFDRDADKLDMVGLYAVTRWPGRVHRSRQHHLS